MPQVDGLVFLAVRGEGVVDEIASDEVVDDAIRQLLGREHELFVTELDAPFEVGEWRRANHHGHVSRRLSREPAVELVDVRRPAARCADGRWSHACRERGGRAPDAERVSSEPSGV